MIKNIGIPLICGLLLFGCGETTDRRKGYLDMLQADIPMCGTGALPASVFLSYLNISPNRAFAKIDHPRLVYPGDPSAFPRIVANDNRVPAGRLNNSELEVDLEVGWGDFFVETDNRPGLRLVALGEKGKAPSIPGPLLRVETGTSIRATIHNTLEDSTITVYGLQRRPAETPDSLFLLPGETRSFTFEAGEPGTYLYWVKLGSGMPFELGEEEQLSGAFIVDPAGGSPPDRIFVMNIFSEKMDTALHPYGWLETLTINGKSWPFTERIRPAIGDTLRWRVINSSARKHPMHLHGFYYDVLSRGAMLSDHIFQPGYRPSVVTETLHERRTMSLQWVPSRPGKWLFHCHLSFHVTPEVRLPGASAADWGDHEPHMAGLVIGIDVKPGPGDLIEKGAPREFSLFAGEENAGPESRRGFSLQADFNPGEVAPTGPGALLVLNQYQPTYITVNNRMSIPTSVHWHGLEIDSWSDGVPEWSASDGKVSPVIYPGEKFTYKLSLMRAGTFIYHSHYDDVHQLTNGLYGPLIVIGANETYEPATDHCYIVGWRNTDPKSLEELELNGATEQLMQHAKTGEVHRLRLMNIAPAGMIGIRMLKDDRPVPLRFFAKDGADLPAVQQVELEASPKFGVGETADFEFRPSAPGIYTLHVTNHMFEDWTQTWEVLPDLAASRKN